MQKGWIEVIAGSMFSGKTEELIKRIRRAEFAKLKTQVFKPIIDTRYHETHVSSHDLNQIAAIPLKNIEDIWKHLKPETQVVGLDEGQFFSSQIVKVAQELSQKGYRVIISGLDMDWKGLPFHPMPELMAIAETIDKPRAICMVCGELASYTQKVSGSEAQVEVGTHNSYEARCRVHFTATIAERYQSSSQNENKNENVATV